MSELEKKLQADWLKAIKANVEVAKLNADLQDQMQAKDAAIEAAREALKVYAARENWWIADGDAVWQEGSADTEPWKIADVALAKLEGAK